MAVEHQADATATPATPPGDIGEATSDTYTPKAGDVGGTLTAMVDVRRRGRFRPDWH